MSTRSYKTSHSANIYIFLCKHFTTWPKLWRDANVRSHSLMIYGTRSIAPGSSSSNALPVWIVKLWRSNKQDWLRDSILIWLQCAPMICNIATTCAAETLGSVARQIMIWCESIFLKLSFLLYGGPNGVRVCQGGEEDLLKSCLTVNGIYVNMIFFFFFWEKFDLCSETQPSFWYRSRFGFVLTENEELYL